MTTNNLDLHRLHACIHKLEHGGSFFRGEGQTTARLYLMIGEVELSDVQGQYLFVAENSLCKQMAVRQFLELIKDIHPQLFEEMMKKKEDWYPDTIVMPTGQVYRFVSVTTLVEDPRWVLGVHYAKVFFDVSGDKQGQLDNNGRLTEVLIILQENGADLV